MVGYNRPQRVAISSGVGPDTRVEYLLIFINQSLKSLLKGVKIT